MCSSKSPESEELCCGAGIIIAQAPTRPLPVRVAKSLKVLSLYHAVTHGEWPLNPLQPNISMNILHTVP